MKKKPYPTVIKRTFKLPTKVELKIMEKSLKRYRYKIRLINIH